MKINKNIIITIISFLATYYLKYVINFEGNITYSNSVVSVVVFASFIVLLRKTYIKENIDKIKSTSFLGIIFSTFLVLGNSIDTNGEVEYTNIHIYLAIIFLSVIINAILVQLYKLIENIEAKKDREKTSKLTESQKQLITFLIIFICWIPVFLAAYPGYFCYDALSEFLLYIFDGLNTWHPIIHTAFMGFIITNVANIFQNFNIAIATYMVIQMLIIAGCFTYCISFLRKYNTLKIIRIISIIYYALFPTVVMFAMCSTKDTLFSAIVLVSIIIAIEALIDKEKFLNSKKEQIKFVLIMFLSIISRNNAIYAYIPFLAIFIIAFKNKKILMPIIGIILLYIIYTQGIYRLLNVYEEKTSEAFSVPLQQIARVYNYNYESLTEEQIEKIYEYITDEQLKTYLPECADNIKHRINLEDIGYIEFFKLWFEIGIKNIGIYIDSFLENTLDFWYPNTIVDGYNRKTPDVYNTETSYFAAMCEKPGEMDSKIPVLNEIYYQISRSTVMQKIPVVSMLFSPGAMAWIFFITIGYSLYKKRKEIAIVLSVILFLWLTLLLGPMVLVRYVLILFFGLPLIMAFLLNGDKFEKIKE